MTKTIELAKQVGAFVDALYAGRCDNTVFTSLELERFAELVRADERARLLAVALHPVGYLAWLDGKPDWSEDCVCEDDVYPRYDEDESTSMPIYTADQVAAAVLRETERCAKVCEEYEEIRCGKHMADAIRARGEG